MGATACHQAGALRPVDDAISELGHIGMDGVLRRQRLVDVDPQSGAVVRVEGAIMHLWAAGKHFFEDGIKPGKLLDSEVGD